MRGCLTPAMMLARTNGREEISGDPEEVGLGAAPEDPGRMHKKGEGQGQLLTPAEAAHENGQKTPRQLTVAISC
jgi:hypothetical protein